ncbi:Exosome complex component RRP4 [Trichinella pseudospiralis]|uniref:6-phosphogluconolactonase n=1 Tax=Trichinella pseudospiralis TaxID=6337 RepID=A0A0V1FXI9_TRIPS|nr:Exosome complex component RRP4 [Trichinella pseudospiralis]
METYYDDISRLSLESSADEPPNLVIPGCAIVDGRKYLRGHGTYFNENEELLVTTVGIAKKTNKFICIETVRSRYSGSVGDYVIGRVVEVLQKRWKVDVNARLNAILLLSSVNLPGGELRRKSEEDEQWMRENLVEGDLISAEVMSVFADGSLSLQLRDIHRKLNQGVLVSVPSFLIKKRKVHLHHFPCKITVSFGINGNIWIAPSDEEEKDCSSGFLDTIQSLTYDMHDNIARFRNCCCLLAENKVMLFEKSLWLAYEQSLAYKAHEILIEPLKKEIASFTKKENQVGTRVMASILFPEDRKGLAIQLGKLIHQLVEQKRLEKNYCVIGLSGGSMPDIMAEALKAVNCDFKHVWFIFCDERHVPFSSAESNFGEYQRKVIAPIPAIQTANFLSIDPDLNLDDCATNYENRLREIFQNQLEKSGAQFPQIDCLLLGIGPDGHICSLFPDHVALKETNRWVVPVGDSPKPPPRRVTLTLPVINNANQIVFVACGASKADIVERIINRKDPFLPAMMVKPLSGRTLFLFDKEASSKLPKLSKSEITECPDAHRCCQLIQKNVKRSLTWSLQ